MHRRSDELITRDKPQHAPANCKRNRQHSNSQHRLLTHSPGLTVSSIVPMPSNNLPNLRHAVGSTVAPGDRICSARKCGAGEGTYVRGGNVHASAVGQLSVVPSNSGDRFVASVVLASGKQYASSQVLSVGQIVLGRVVRVITQQAFIEIVSADSSGPLRETHSGSIRKEDVRAGATEEVEIYASFRPGDIVLARIISLGDSRRYYLSTAEAELGVIRASCCSCGANMTPINWKEMECSCKQKEPRKCAKPREVANESPEEGNSKLAS
mmetsp:Transcript_39630/g.81418  ORF Transcript_39630/g.81418 Transcript_39630/m.81418 type:complete len:268 (+) Transcript_39630:1049-1852(+)